MWKAYNHARKDEHPNRLLVAAIGTGGYALDLGAGSLVDSKYLVSRGYVVDAVDSEPSFVEYAVPGVTPVVAKFDEFNFPKAKYDLVNANFALPFNKPKTFTAMFGRLVSSLKPGGVFVGQFFGPEDGWGRNKNFTFHSKEELEGLLQRFSKSKIVEVKKEGTLALGGTKQWHYFEVAAVL